MERGCLFLPDSKSGQKTVILNAPALAVLNGLERIGPYVVPGIDPEQPRHDLKRPWDAVTKRAGVMGVRLHDLRHTYASFGAGGGLGLPIIGRLLGHSQPATTARYAHLDGLPTTFRAPAGRERTYSPLDRVPRRWFAAVMAATSVGCRGMGTEIGAEALAGREPTRIL